MRLVVRGGAKLSGSVTAPPSKSHTHRALTVASLASGGSAIANPLPCDDTAATVASCRAFGASVDDENRAWMVRGFDGRPATPTSALDARESGTTLRFMSAIASLSEGTTTLTGRASLLRRPMGPLLRALLDLGAKLAESTSSGGTPPVKVAGRLLGGEATIDGSSSQFVSALLMASPFAECDTTLRVRGAVSKPYVEMTLRRLRNAGAKVEAEGETFHIDGGQSLKPIEFRVPGDHSSAAFLKAAAFVTDSRIQIEGLDADDCQGDRVIDVFLKELASGCRGSFDLAGTPDLLPVMAVLGCRAEGETVLENVAHARVKESDRISAISEGLRRMGADISENRDGLAVRMSRLKGAHVDGCGDHRIVMALTVAGLFAEGETVIDGAEAISKSYPGFVRDMVTLGADIRTVA